MIKVHFDKESGKIKGYYPDSINYASIPEPYIEIEDNAQVLDKQMCVVNKVYQEYVKPLDIQLQEAKALKLYQLKANKDKSLDGFVLISVDSFNFNIYKNQLEVLSARIYYLESNNLTSSNWTDNDNFRRELTLSQFKDLYARSRNHYTALDDNVYALYTDLKNEIKDISVDKEYFNENQEPITALQALENININF